MLKDIYRATLISILIVMMGAGIAQAEETFENVGTVTLVDKAAKVVFIDGERMAIASNANVQYKDEEGHLLKFIEEGMLVNISGTIGSNGVPVITSAYIHTKKQ